MMAGVARSESPEQGEDVGDEELGDSEGTMLC